MKQTTTSMCTIENNPKMSPCIRCILVRVQLLHKAEAVCNNRILSECIRASIPVTVLVGSKWLLPGNLTNAVSTKFKILALPHVPSCLCRLTLPLCQFLCTDHMADFEHDLTLSDCCGTNGSVAAPPPKTPGPMK